MGTIDVTANGLMWRVHVTQLFAEILGNPSLGVMKQPLLILDDLLRQVAARAIELDDPKLNQLMIRLTLYSIADPRSADFDSDTVQGILYPEGAS